MTQMKRGLGTVSSRLWGTDLQTGAKVVTAGEPPPHLSAPGLHTLLSL